MTESASPDSRAGSMLSKAASGIRRHWGVLVAVLIPVVTVLTIVIPLIADAGARVTTVDTLAIDGVVVGDTPPDPEAEIILASAPTVGLASEEIVNKEGNAPVWKVRYDAPFATIPVCLFGDAPCEADQVAWLDTWGRRAGIDTWNGYLTLSNTATDGSSMSVRNIHSVGTFARPEVPEVTVTLEGGKGAGSEIIQLSQVLGTEQPATFAGSYFGLPDGSPAVINIAPGEFIQTVTRFSRLDSDLYADFTGSLVADVEVAGQSKQVSLFTGLTRIAPSEISTTTLRLNGDWIGCGDGGWDDCTLDLFIEQLHADPKFPS